MSFTDQTYYVLDINIPSSTYNNLTAHIAKYEKEIIMMLFGYSLGTLVLAYNVSTSPQRIKDIVEGKVYTSSSGDEIKWNGLTNTDKISLLSYYVYWWYVKNKNSTLQGIGNQKLKGENSENARAGIKMSSAWSRLEDLYGDYCDNDYDASAYNFLTEHESTYPEWVFEQLGTSNNFDL